MPKLKKKREKTQTNNTHKHQNNEKTHLSVMLAFADERYTTFSVWVSTDSVDHNHLHSC